MSYNYTGGVRLQGEFSLLIQQQSCHNGQKLHHLLTTYKVRVDRYGVCKRAVFDDRWYGMVFTLAQKLPMWRASAHKRTRRLAKRRAKDGFMYQGRYGILCQSNACLLCKCDCLTVSLSSLTRQTAMK